MAAIIFVDANGTKWSIEATALPDTNYAFSSILQYQGNQAAIDASGNQAMQNGGSNSALNQTAAAVIKASPGRLRKLIIIAPGSTSGAFTLNDCLTTGAANAANTVFSMAYNAPANIAGAIFNLDLPMKVGIVLSAVPGGGSPVCVLAYD